MRYLLLVALSACATQSKRTDTIKAAAVTLDATRDGFLAYDKQHEADIVAKATSADDARKQLVEYQAARDCATCPGSLLIGAYRALAAAATVNDDPSLAGALAAVAQVQTALHVLTGGKL